MGTYIFTNFNSLLTNYHRRVFKAQCKLNPKNIVALKKLETDKETQGFPITALREIINLKRLDHPNVVSLKEVVMSKRN